ncbi:hypothetical protein BU25DRAFT_106445 [Macroventuria anomochaeta]|uniref:Uncharacterized protein n=1 Tax=Macroventuria anomochaeta TaxID=301207 RepID=A0ACB6RW04_9PLEO|nr:uncharacterized protein BU25DRAFT_106445 [Macroventuria anomochaeta]KAF2625968.1 hypothetical protein BU25DRAFT_106445 [Macroventuria anomochaeta]
MDDAQPIPEGTNFKLSNLLREADFKQLWSKLEKIGNDRTRILRNIGFVNFQLMQGPEPGIPSNILDNRWWLKEFDEPDTQNFETSQEQMQRDLTDTTYILEQYLEYKAREIFSIKLRVSLEHLDEFVFKADSFSRWSTESRDEHIKAGSKLLSEIERWMKDDIAIIEWHYLCRNVRMFCRRVGCLETSFNPFINLEKLASMDPRPGITKYEKALQARIVELEKKVDEQTRQLKRLDLGRKTQAEVSFRVVLEKLGGAVNNKDIARSWKAFWKAALYRAAKRPETPLTGVLKAFNVNLANVNNGTSDQSFIDLLNVGNHLYGSLSCNTHNSGVRNHQGPSGPSIIRQNAPDYEGEYDVDPMYWDVMPYAILRALAPLQGNVDAAGYVLWKDEKRRHF